MNPVALITGASRGIGRGIALELAGAGFDLVINYAGNETAACETAKACVQRGAEAGKTIRAEVFQADIGDAAARRALVEFTRTTHGRIDLLVNNAGITSIGRRDVLEAREDEWDRLMAINLKGPMFLSQACANWMIEQEEGKPKTENRKPKIITISSISAHTVSVNRADYCVAKAGLGMMTKVLAVRLAEHGINVYEICPGIIATDMTGPVKEKYDKLIAEGLTPIRRWGTPGDVGKAVVAIATDAFPFSTGEVINVDGGFHLRTL
jgi:NAD(P)-dependent dehydrogenase (short-subunit alcohol dehydrogenase family)